MMEKREIANALIRVARELLTDDGTFDRRSNPDFLPPRTDLSKRHRKETIDKEDKADYADTIYDEDLRG